MAKEIKALTTCVIDRNKWYRGKGPTTSKLLLSDGMMCCLGMFCLQAGYSKQDILQIGSPSRISHPPNQLCDGGGNLETAIKMMGTNDRVSIDDAEREAKLKELGLKLDPPCDFQFIN